MRITNDACSEHWPGLISPWSCVKSLGGTWRGSAVLEVDRPYAARSAIEAEAHTLMQDAHDRDSGFLVAVDDDVRPHEMKPVRFRQFG